MCFSITKSKIISATTSTMALLYSVILMKLFLVFMSSIFLVDAAGKSDVSGSREPVKAVVGDDVILPCHLEPPVDVKNLTVEWKCNDSTVHLYRSRNDHLVDQHERFKDRTSLFPDEMSRGNISLKLTNVTEQDAGNYSCFVPKLNSQVKEGYVTLIVETQTEHDEKPQTGDRSGDFIIDIVVAAVVAVVAVVAVAAVAVHFLLKNK